MFDRTEFDLRYEAHKARVTAVNGNSWQDGVDDPGPTPRALLASLLRALAARLDPTPTPLPELPPHPAVA